MNSPQHIEEVLDQMGKDWPIGDTLVAGVLRGLHRTPRYPAPENPHKPTLWRVSAIAASIFALVIGWSAFRGGTSVYAQSRDAVHRARSFEMIVRVLADGDKPEQQLIPLSFERGVGYREEQPDVTAIGNTEGSWRYLKHAKLAIRSKSTGVAERVDRFLDNELGREPNKFKYERYAAGDQVIDGRKRQAFLRTGAEDLAGPDGKAGGRRVVLLVDDQSRITRVITESLSRDKWVAQFISDWKYDIPLERSLFQPTFPADVRVVDADAAFEHYVDLDKAIYREERKGLHFAIHHAERIENGGLFVVSSVRGTDDTLKKYPLTRRDWGPGLSFVDGPATHYRGSPEYKVPGNVVTLATVDHEGINVSWWVLMPLDGADDAPFDVAPGKVRVPLGITPTGGAYGKATFQDADGVLQNLTWEVELAVPKPDTVPPLAAVARRVYVDLEGLEGVTFKFLNLGNRGLTMAIVSDLTKITARQFTDAVVGEVLWWKDGGPTNDPRFLEVRKTPFSSK